MNIYCFITYRFCPRVYHGTVRVPKRAVPCIALSGYRQSRMLHRASDKTPEQSRTTTITRPTKLLKIGKNYLYNLIHSISIIKFLRSIFQHISPNNTPSEPTHPSPTGPPGTDAPHSPAPTTDADHTTAGGFQRHFFFFCLRPFLVSVCNTRRHALTETDKIGVRGPKLSGLRVFLLHQLQFCHHFDIYCCKLIDPFFFVSIASSMSRDGE